MDHKEASTILINLSKKELLTAKEKEAVLIAIGVLAWTSLAKARIKTMGERHQRIKNGELEARRRKRPFRH